MLVVFPLRVGACALLTESTTPAQLADAVAEHGVTVLATAPTAYRAILTGGKGSQLQGLRAAVSAGEHISQQVWEHLRDELGLEVIDGIGATELLHIFISAAGADIRPGATGKPVPGYRAAILAPDGDELPAGQKGLLAVIGPVGCRYLADDRQRQYVMNGWNVTGDTFVRDEDGYYYYEARTDNMIVSSGYNIGGPEVEAAINEHPDVAESAVVGAPDPERGSIVCAFVVLKRRRRRRRGQGQGDPGLREADPGAVQVPARGPLHRRAAAEHQRQDAAQPPAQAAQVGAGGRRRRRERGGQRMRIAVVGGGPGGLYFAALMKGLDEGHEVTVWERNAPDDTFGFGVVFSDETLGSIEGADRVVHEQMESRFARWTDIDVTVTDATGTAQPFTVGGQGFAAMSRKELLQNPADPCC